MTPNTCAAGSSSVRADQLERLVGQVAELFLGDVEHGQQRRLLGRVLREQPLDPLLRLS